MQQQQDQAKVMLSLEEELRADTRGLLAMAIRQRLGEINFRLEHTERAHLTPAEHTEVEAAKQAVLGAQLAMQLYEISRKRDR